MTSGLHPRKVHAEGLFRGRSIHFVHFGKPPADGRSYDSIGDCTYLGLCCYPAILVGRRIRLLALDLDLEATRNKLREAQREGRPIYLVIGEMVGFGRDGEPIVTVDDAIHLADCSISEVEVWDGRS